MMKSCPFCGSDNVDVWQTYGRGRHRGWWVQVKCFTCGATARGVYCGNESPESKGWEGTEVEYAITLWNTRKEA